MTIFLDCMSPCSSSVLRRNATYRKARRAAVSPSLPKGMFWSCFRWGLHSLPCYQGSGGLLHHHSTLTGIPRRFLFCCTGLGVTPTGRYPAPCPVKPGLSSSAAFRHLQLRLLVLLVHRGQVIFNLGRGIFKIAPSPTCLLPRWRARRIFHSADARYVLLPS